MTFATSVVDVDEAAASRVARGCRELDASRPDWWQAVDVDRLDVRSLYHCVLGQLYGRYVDAPRGWLTYPWHYGFSVKPAGPWSPTDAVTYDDLTREWRRVILARRRLDETRRDEAWWRRLEERTPPGYLADLVGTRTHDERNEDE